MFVTGAGKAQTQECWAAPNIGCVEFPAFGLGGG